MTQIKVLTGGMGQAVNPNEQPTERDYYKRKSEGVNWGDYLYQQWQAFHQANPPYPIINPGLAKEGDLIEGELVWQYIEKLKWITYNPPPQFLAQFKNGNMPDLVLFRQAFLIDDTPKEGEKEVQLSGPELIANERQRQIDVEKYDTNRDREFYENGQLIGAAGCYLSNALNKAYANQKYLFPPFSRFQIRESIEQNSGEMSPTHNFIDAWPWDDQYDKRDKHSVLRSLVIAGALIAAEIDRINKSKERPSLNFDSDPPIMGDAYKSHI